MVFLTMLPDETDPVREPVFTQNFHWPMDYHHQALNSLHAQPEESEENDGCSSHEESNEAKSSSSKNTTPPPEAEAMIDYPQAKNDTKATDLIPPLGSDETATHLDETFIVATPSVHTFAETEGDHMRTQSQEYSQRFQRGSIVSASVANQEDLTQTAVKRGEVVAIANSKADNFLTSDKSTRNANSKLVPESDSLELVTPVVKDIANNDPGLNDSAPKPKASTAIFSPTEINDTDPPSTRLRHMVANLPSMILCPGVYDGLSARIALQVGFKGLYMTGAGTTASCLGASDLGIAHLHDMKANAEMIANLEPDGPPVIADMDTGYGGPLIISRAVKQYARAGVAAFHIEDQVPEKRCGHLAGKEVVDVETYLRRIRACLHARAQIRSDIVIIARTDALQSRGYDDCLDRLRRARDLGADMGILEGLLSKEAAAQAVRDLAPWPLCYNSVENGHSPLITAAEAEAMGYRLMIFSFAGIAPAYMAILETFTRLKEHGVTGCKVGPKKIFEVCGLEEEMRIDETAGGSAFVKGV